MKERIKNLLGNIRFRYFRHTLYKRDRRFIKEHSLPKLSKNEWNSLKAAWPCFKLKESDLIYLKLYKKEHGFDPYFISDYPLQLILKRTNPLKQVEALQHKGLVDVWFPELNFPEVYVRCIAGILYDKDMNIITPEDSLRIIKRKDLFIIKPTVDTGCGKGVKRITTKDKTDNELNDILKSYKRDYIVQEAIKQSKEIEYLNPTSLNTCRVTSIHINGKWSSSTIFKVGKKGADKDNWSSSYFIGVNEDGTLKDCGYDNNLKKVYKTDTGIVFKNIKLPKFEEMISFTKKYHLKYFPQCGIVGWDIFIDSENNVRVIEVNLDSPGVVGEQIASGTFFKDFRDDIVKIMTNNI